MQVETRTPSPTTGPEIAPTVRRRRAKRLSAVLMGMVIVAAASLGVFRHGGGGDGSRKANPTTVSVEPAGTPVIHFPSFRRPQVRKSAASTADTPTSSSWRRVTVRRAERTFPALPPGHEGDLLRVQIEPHGRGCGARASRDMKRWSGRPSTRFSR
jgi:hypothetical protein